MREHSSTMAPSRGEEPLSAFASATTSCSITSVSTSSAGSLNAACQRGLSCMPRITSSRSGAMPESSSTWLPSAAVLAVSTPRLWSRPRKEETRGSCRRLDQEHRHVHRLRQQVLEVDEEAAVAADALHALRFELPRGLDHGVVELRVAHEHPVGRGSRHGAVEHRVVVAGGVADVAGHEGLAHVEEQDADAVAVGVGAWSRLVDGHPGTSYMKPW